MVNVEEQLLADVEKHGEAAVPLAQREEHDQGEAPEPAPGEQGGQGEAVQVITLKGVSLPPQGAEGGL